MDLLQLFSTGPTSHGDPADDGVDRVAGDEAREQEVQQQGHDENHKGPCELAADVSR